MTIGLANFLLTSIIPSVFTPSASEIMNKFGIFLIDDMVEYLGYEILQSKWADFGALFMQFTQNKSHVLRQAACYGLGIYGENTPVNQVSGELVNNWLQALITSVKFPKG